MVCGVLPFSRVMKNLKHVAVSIPCRALRRDVNMTCNLECVQLIGGNTTTTDAAYLSEYFNANDVKTSVVAVPCTISGGMKNNFVVSSCSNYCAVRLTSHVQCRPVPLFRF